MSLSMMPPTQSNAGRKYSIIMVEELPKFDLESYIQNYQGRTRLHRLQHIGTSSIPLAVEALKTAVIEAKRGRDVKKYLLAVDSLEATGSTDRLAKRDLDWVNTTNKKNSQDAARLEEELKGYKNNLIKESVRMGNEELGLHYQEVGDLPRAFEAFSRMRQDAVAAKHISDVSRHLISVSMEQDQWLTVLSNVAKIQGVSQNPDEEKATQPYLKASEGLARMELGEYYLAARAFLAVDSGMGISCNTFMSPNDVATYGGLCALASMERGELQSRVLENSSFRTYLELEPHIRRAISFFVNSRYSSCLEILESYRADYLLDIHLRTHLEELYHQVRTKSIVQYFIPFSCVTLDSLNAAFAAPGTTVDKELSKMIERKELKGRIDTRNRLLTSVPTPPRAVLHREALKTAKEYEREARRRIQHMNILGAELEVKGPKRGGNHNLLNNSLDDDSYGNFSVAGRSLRSRGY